MKKDIEPGMLTYNDVEPVQIRAQRVEVETVTVRRKGLLGRVMDWILGPMKEQQTMTVLSRFEQELLKKYMENPEKVNDAVNASAVKAEEMEKACKRITVLGRGHHIRNADGTITDVSNNPNYECK